MEIFPTVPQKKRMWQDCKMRNTMVGSRSECVEVLRRQQRGPRRGAVYFLLWKLVFSGFLFLFLLVSVHFCFKVANLVHVTFSQQQQLVFIPPQPIMHPL